MAQKPLPGKCVHCLKWSDDRNWDHVFPESWYPDTTPPNIEKWKIPTCRECNDAYGKLETRLLTQLGLCLSPVEKKSLGITNKVIRSVNPNHGKSTRDKRARQAKLNRVRNEMISGHSIPLDAIYPGFGPDPNEPIENLRAVLIDHEDVTRLSEKLVRGITFIEDGFLIEEPYQIEVHIVNEEAVGWVSGLLTQRGELHTRGPGISLWRTVPVDAPGHAMFRIEIWGKFRFYATVDKQGAPHPS